jgi:uncharacterized protein YxjI
MSANGTTFVLKRKRVSPSGDGWIDDERGEHVYAIDGEFFHVRRTVKLRNPAGNELYHIGKSLAHVHRTYEIKRGDRLVATLQQGLISIGDKVTVKLESGDGLNVKGDIIDHDFTVRRDGREVIAVTQKLVSVHDSYGARVAEGFDPDLAMAIVVALSEMEREGDTGAG